jgi:hypothetical protein
MQGGHKVFTSLQTSVKTAYRGAEKRFALLERIAQKDVAHKMLEQCTKFVYTSNIHIEHLYLYIA